jgi:DNA-binding GntR family transcriptional regulator
MERRKISIKRNTLKGQAYEYLKTAILRGDMESGRIYSEQYFADLLEISRTPVREAVSQLSQEGFVQIHPNIGVSVKQISADDVREMFQLRSAIECYCCKFAAERVGSPEGEALLRSLEGYIAQEEQIYYSQGAPAECMKHDSKFHLAIVEFTENSQIVEIMNRLRSRINLVGIKTLYKPGRLEATLNEHRRIVEAIRQGLSVEAYKATEHHFAMAQKILLASDFLN